MGAGAAAEAAGSDATSCVGVGACAWAKPAPARLSTKAHPGKQVKARIGKTETLNIIFFMAW
jgi:hypothetical protein